MSPTRAATLAPSPRPGLSRLTVLAVLAVLAVVAAALTVAPGYAGPDSTVKTVGTSLDGDWLLTGATVDGDEIDLDAGPVTLRIDGTTWSGVSACDLYFVTVVHEAGALTVGEIARTKMGCPKERKALQRAYFRAVGRVTTAHREGSALTLTGEGVSLVLAFQPEPETLPLVGTAWELNTVTVGPMGSAPRGRRATLVLKQDGSVVGSTGCRSFSARWKPAGEGIFVTGLQTGKRRCRSTVRTQDRHVLRVLRGRVALELGPASLTLHHGRLGLVYLAD